MNYDNSYLQHYQTLGIDTPCDWDKVKKMYRKLANTWHPDRHSGNEYTRSIAEEKIKEINLAYKALSEYHRSHQTLPPLRSEYKAKSSAAQRSARTSESSVNSEDSQTSSVNPDSVAEDGTDQNNSYDVSEPSLIRRALILGGVTLAAYLMWQSLDPFAKNINALTEISESPNFPDNHISLKPDSAESIDDSRLGKRHFTYDSTLGEVHAAQGTPTRIEDNIWHYGKSKVYFKQGRVQYWIADLENPLNILSDPKFSKPKKGFFTIGSKKREVRSIQGKPDYVAQDSWEYGMSKVYFSGDYVVKWYSSPLDPLKAEK